MYFWWPITCKQLLYNLRVNNVNFSCKDSSVKGHLSNISDHSCYPDICWLHKYVLGSSISEKWAKIVLFVELFNDLKSAVLE